MWLVAQQGEGAMCFILVSDPPMEIAAPRNREIIVRQRIGKLLRRALPAHRGKPPQPNGFGNSKEVRDE